MRVREHKALRRLAYFSLGYTIAVILWGAYVRISFSGDGCGDDWPTCAGEAIPTAPSTERIIEYTHRVSSGISGLLVLALFVWAWKAFQKGHPARKSGLLALVFMILEALIGALIVKFQLVADNPSLARAYGMMLHLINTYLLLTFQALFAVDVDPRLTRRAPRTRFIALFVGLIVVSLFGVVAALGDSLFPTESLREAFKADFAVTSHLFLRWRILHPITALLLGGTIAYLGFQQGRKSFGSVAAVISLFQIAFGSLNLLLHAPPWAQVLHLFLADLLWLACLAWATQLRALVPESNLPTDAQSANGS